MKSTLLEMLSYLATGLSTALAGGAFIHFKAKRKTAHQKARQEENTADSGRFKVLEDEIRFLGKRLEYYRHDQLSQERKIQGMQKILTVTIGQKKYAERHICLRLDCKDRMPDLGSFITEDAKFEEHEGDSQKHSK
jgi:hypothetical protein